MVDNGMEEGWIHEVKERAYPQARRAGFTKAGVGGQKLVLKVRALLNSKLVAF